MGMTSRSFALLGRDRLPRPARLGVMVIVQDRRHCLLTYTRARNKASPQAAADRVNASTSYSYYYSCILQGVYVRSRTDADVEKAQSLVGSHRNGPSTQTAPCSVVWAARNSLGLCAFAAEQMMQGLVERIEINRNTLSASGSSLSVLTGR